MNDEICHFNKYVFIGIFSGMEVTGVKADMQLGLGIKMFRIRQIMFEINNRQRYQCGSYIKGQELRLEWRIWRY